jgi:hypothetical protein
MIRSPMRTSIGATGGVFVGVLLGLFKPALGWIDLSTITDFRLALSGIFIANLPALFQRDRLPDAIEDQFSTVSRAVKSGKLSRAQAKFYYAQIVTTALDGVDPVWRSLRGLVNYATGWTFCMSASYVMGER